MPEKQKAKEEERAISNLLYNTAFQVLRICFHGIKVSKPVSTVVDK